MDACFKKHGFPPHFKKGYVVNNISLDDCENEEQQEEESSEVSNFSLTKDQYEGLMALLQKSQAQSTSVSSTNNTSHYTN